MPNFLVASTKASSRAGNYNPSSSLTLLRRHTPRRDVACYVSAGSVGDSHTLEAREQRLRQQSLDNSASGTIPAFGTNVRSDRLTLLSLSLYTQD
jgi:hypothetical protein